MSNFLLYFLSYCLTILLLFNFSKQGYANYLSLLEYKQAISKLEEQLQLYHREYQLHPTPYLLDIITKIEYSLFELRGK